jgi:hypothetical protein
LDFVIALIKIKSSGSEEEEPMWYFVSPSVLDMPIDWLVPFPSRRKKVTPRAG